MYEQRQNKRGKDKDKEELSGRYEISPLDSKLNPLFVFYALQNHQKEKLL
jgi:LytS/YehU family sensor histidine kinase